MGDISAATAAAMANVDVNSAVRGWEWLHLISFQMGGINNFPQLPENLVAGTYDCNSEMIGLEEAIKTLILDKDIVLTVTVSVKLVPGTHVGIGVVSYDVEHNNKKSHFEFNVRSQNRPFSGVNIAWLKALHVDLGL
jgi:hypothetical protein